MSLGMDDFDGQLRQTADFIAFLKTPGLMSGVVYEPTDATSVNAAIRAMEEIIDAKVAEYHPNPQVNEIARAAKEAYADQIRQVAATHIRG